MKTPLFHIVKLILLCLLLHGNQLYAQHEEQLEEDYITISGIVRDNNSHKRMEYVNVSVTGSDIGTVTNREGGFTIKIKKSLQAKSIEFSHIGYRNSLIPIEGMDLSNIRVWLIPNANLLNEVIVRGYDPRILVEQAILKVSSNYSREGNLLTGFYRETTQKRRRYITIAEAIVDVYKTAYTRRDVLSDRVQIYKGRKLLSQKPDDTLAVKLLGGPNLSINVDVVKNPDMLLHPEELNNYHFHIEESVMFDKRPHYVIGFEPRVILPYPLYRGKLYIDKERLSFSRVEIALDMDDLGKATQAILKRKPRGLRFKPIEVSFFINYKENKGVTYLSYIRNTVRFKCDWKRKLFSTNYTIVSEMVVTDRKVQKEGISYRQSFKRSQSLSDRVIDYVDEHFWGAYNIIEPTESLESAVKKLKKRSDF